MLRQLSQGKKSFSACWREPAIGVVPFGTMVFKTCLILAKLSGAKGTSSFVSLQSWGGNCFWCPNTRKATWRFLIFFRLSRILRKRRDAMLNLVSLCHLPYILWEASKTNRILVSGFGLAFSTCPCPNPTERKTRRIMTIKPVLFNNFLLMVK